jgi:hypothetical protein
MEETVDESGKKPPIRINDGDASAYTEYSVGFFKKTFNI